MTSTQETHELGFLPSPAQVTAVLTRDAMVQNALLYQPVGDFIYDELPEWATRPPNTDRDAYRQTAYYLALGLRRALARSQFGVAKTLSDALQTTLEEGDALASNLACSTLGLFCSARDMAGILTFGLDAIETSGLDPDDAVRIRLTLRRLRLAVRTRHGVRVAALVGVGGLLGVVAWRAVIRSTRLGGR
jgi:hypothetical protein